MSATTTNCHECQKEIDVRSPRVWQQVIGWERKRNGGGTNHIALRKPQPVWCCAECIDLKLAGESRNQFKLF